MVKTVIKSSKRVQGFSLIEIMIAMAIAAGIVVGIVVLVNSRTAKIKESTARTAVQGFKSNVEAYKTEHGGRLPESLADTLQMGLPDDKKAEQLNDPWQHPYRYQQPSQHDDPDGYDIWSMGPNNSEDTIIGSWKQ